MTPARDLVLWGATGQAKVLNELIQGTSLRLAVLVDNQPLQSPIPGIPLVVGMSGLIEWLGQRASLAPLVGGVAVGGAKGKDRIELLERLEQLGIASAQLIHRTAFVAFDASLGAGCQILAQASVCTHTRLGRAVIINTSASVDHDCVLDDGVHIGPGAKLAGEVQVGARAFVGTGAVILPRIRIGEDAIVGAGAVVIRNVPDGCTVAGAPARELSKT